MIRRGREEVRSILAIIFCMVCGIATSATDPNTIKITRQHGNNFVLTVNLSQTESQSSPSDNITTIYCYSESCHISREVILTKIPALSGSSYSSQVQFPDTCLDLTLRYTFLKQPENIYYSFYSSLTDLMWAGPDGLKISATPATASYTDLIQEAKDQRLPESEMAGYLRFRSHMNSEILKGTWNKRIADLPSTSGTSCTNADFETGDMTGWAGTTGLNPGCCLTPGFITGRQTITTGTGLDACGGFPVVCPGGSYSLQLGANVTGGLAEQITQTFTVSPTSTNFTYKYAVVLEDPGHPVSQQPFFKVEMLDQSGNEIPCALYFVAAGQGIPGFQSSSTCASVVYKPWSSVSIDLTAYVGQAVTIRFTAADCTLGGHYGYAYIDGSCMPLALTSSGDVCQGGNVTLTAPAGSAGYSWSPGGQTTPTITVSTSGTYSCTLTSFQGCTVTLSIPVNIFPAPVATMGISNAPCSPIFLFTDSSTISSGSLTGGNWTFGDGTTSALLNPSHSYVTPGTYTVSLQETSSLGCPASVTHIVQVLPPVLTTVVPTAVTCHGGTNGSAIATTTGGTAPYLYSWSNNVTNSGNPNIPAGTYVLTVTDSKGCITQNTVIITEPLALSVTSSVTNPNCFGLTGAATIIPTGGTGTYNYSWNSVPAQLTPIATGLPAGTYVCTVNDQNSCTAGTSVVITQPALLTSTITATNPTCFGGTNGSASVTSTGGSGAFSYSWNTTPGQTVSNATGLGLGTYTCVVSDQQGCTTSSSISLTQPSPLLTNIVSSNNVKCFGGSDGSLLSLTTGGLAPYTYSWNTVPAQQTPGAINLPAGTYIVSIQDANHCNSLASALITQPAQLATQIPSSSDPLCYGNTNGSASSVASGGTTPYTYSWNTIPIQYSASAVNLSAGTYALTVTDGLGCVSVSTVMLNQPNILQSSVRAQSPTCYGAATGWINTTVNGGTSPYNYSWNVSGGNSANLTGQGAGIYFLNIVDMHGCRLIDSVTLTQPQPLLANLLSSDETCYGGNNGWLQVTASGGTGPYLYSWNTVPVQTGSSVIGLYAGTYSLTVTDKNGCDVIASSSIHQPTPLTLHAYGGSTICAGQAAGLYALASGGNGSYTYSWNNGIGIGASQLVNPAMSTAYLVEVTDGAGCIGPVDTVTVQVLTLNPGNVNITPSLGICIGGSTSLEAWVTGSTGTVTYSWLNIPGAGNSPGPFTVNPSTTTTYSVQVVNSCNASEYASVTVTVNPLPVVSLSPQKVASCERVPITMVNNVNNAGASYQWLFGDGSGSVLESPSHTYDATGFYTITLILTSAFGCVSMGTTEDSVTIFPATIASFTSADQASELAPVIAFTNTSVNAKYSYWEFGDNVTSIERSPEHTYPGKGEYTIILRTKTDKGCLDSTMKKIDIVPEFSFYVPNAFTPNGDGVNDVFNGKGEEIADFVMMIFDRWGQLIYTTEDKNKGWDGRANSGVDIAQIDVYVYKISLHDTFGNRHDYLGSVSLIK